MRNRTRMRSILSLALITSALAALLLAGCSQSNLSQGRKALDDGRYDAAETYLKSALQENPNDPRVLKALGRLQYHQGSIAEAKQNLTIAQRSLPADPQLNLYLGFCSEAQGDFATAANAYEQFLERNPKSRVADNVRGRLLYVKNERLRKQVAEAVKAEATLGQAEPQPLTVAVLPFVVAADATPQVKALADGLAATLWYDLASIEELTVVERLQVNYLMQELQLTQEGLTSEESAPRVGKIVSAAHLVNASVNAPAEDKLSLDAALVMTTTSEYKPAYNADNDLKKALELEKNMTLAILDSLGIEIKGSRRKALLDQPTDSYEAFLAFSQGIKLYDQGNYVDAKKFFDEARSIDPRFGLAGQFASETQLLISNAGDLQQFDSMVMASIEATTQVITSLTDELRAIGAPDTNPRVEDEPSEGRSTATVSGEVR